MTSTAHLLHAVVAILLSCPCHGKMLVQQSSQQQRGSIGNSCICSDSIWNHDVSGRSTFFSCGGVRLQQKVAYGVLICEAYLFVISLEFIIFFFIYNTK